MKELDPPFLSIDEADTNSPLELEVVEYVDEIYSFYRKAESIPMDYMPYQTDINPRMRAVLVDWLIELHHKLKLRQETLYLAINLIDRYLSQKLVMRRNLQQVGVMGIFLACKYEEVNAPLLDELIYLLDGGFTREDALKLEESMLYTLNFELSVPTPFVFMRRFLRAAESDSKLEIWSFYLLELCLLEYEMLRFPPSLLSAAAVYTGRWMLIMSPTWSEALQYHTSYSEDQLLECVRLMIDLHENADYLDFFVHSKTLH